ncbi:predicted protein, partial [Nematostella vectensis]
MSSNNSCDGASSVESPTTLGIVISVALIAVIMLALAGNTVVCIAFYRSSNLQSLTVLFILSLAVTDILVASISMPIWLYFQFSHSSFTCLPDLFTAWKCLDVLFSTASIMNLCAISIDRQFAITKPLHYHTIMTTKRALFALTGISLYAVVLSGLVATRWSYYPLFIFIVAFISPLIVMIQAYSHIFKTALMQARRVYPIRQAYYFKKELKAAKTLAIVMGSFIACWAPFFLANLIVQYENVKISPDTVTGIKFLHYVSSALNPVIYSCTNREFRLKIFRVLPC